MARITLRDVSTSRKPGLDVCARFGGVTIYAKTNATLHSVVDLMGRTIENCAGHYPTLDRRRLLRDVTEALDQDVEDRLFGAMLGSRLRLGVMDCIPCGAVTGKVFRVYLLAVAVPTFSSNLQTASAFIKREGTTAIADIRAFLGLGEGPGMWPAALHVAARLSLLGKASYVDKFSVRDPFAT